MVRTHNWAGAGEVALWGLCNGVFLTSLNDVISFGRGEDCWYLFIKNILRFNSVRRAWSNDVEKLCNMLDLISCLYCAT